MTFFRVTPELNAQFQEDGYIVVPGLLNSEESDLLQRLAKADVGWRIKRPGGRIDPD